MSSFDHKAIDDVIHGRVRLAIMAYLLTAGRAEFADLKRQVDVSDGNLSTHLRKLEDAGYVAVHKSFRDRRPLTEASLSAQGRAAFTDYLQQIERLLSLGEA